MAEIILTQAENGTRVAAARGDMIVIRLPENATTGYRWQVETSGTLTFAGDDSVPSSTAIGAGGERTLRFVAQQPGPARIELTMRRPWETTVAPSGQFGVTVEVRG